MIDLYTELPVSTLQLTKQGPTELVRSLKHVRDYEYYEGPLFSLFRDPEGIPYVYYWYDVDTLVNHWLVVRVSDHTLRLYERHKINMFTLMRVSEHPGYDVKTGFKGEVVKIDVVPVVSDFVDNVMPKKRPEHHGRPSVVAFREMSGNLCVDEDCDLSGGYAHAGGCEPCGCPDNHAIEECPLLDGPP